MACIGMSTLSLLLMSLPVVASRGTPSRPLPPGPLGSPRIDCGSGISSAAPGMSYSAGSSANNSPSVYGLNRNAPAAHYYDCEMYFAAENTL